MARKTKAIVIGGSMAGMMAARVLSERFDQVIIIERDNIPDTPVARGGVPQGRHVHSLLARGEEIMEDFFPGLGDDLTANGAPLFKWGWNGRFVSSGGHSMKYDTGVRSHLVSRVLLEHLVRNRLMQIKNVSYMMRTQVNHLIEDSGRITGIEVLNRATKEVETLNADLIVDASGRGSKAPEWLEELDYTAPEETHVNSFLGYATRWFEVPESYEAEYLVTFVFPDLSTGVYRGGAMFFVEDNQVVVTLAGANKDYAPTDEEGFLEFAKSLHAPYLYEFIKDAKPVSPIYGYQRTRNRIRHYEKLNRRPENFVILGDAHCAFNPVYGQGMTKAALEAEALRDVLKRYSIQHLDGFAGQFQKKIATVVQDAWLMATAEDMRYPGTEGSKPTLQLRMMQVFSGWMLETGTHDKVILETLLKMMNLQVSGTAALHPKVLLRILWHKFIHPKKRRELAASDSSELKLDRAKA